MQRASAVVVAALVALIGLTVSAVAQDYILQAGSLSIPASCGSYSPLGWDNAADSLRVLRWNVPPVVTPGMTVPVRVKWQMYTDHVPVMYTNYFGDWNPGQEIAQGALYGSIPGNGEQFQDAFTFTAPSEPGWYRIRFMQWGAFEPITNFYGRPGKIPNSFTEVTFHVGYPILAVAEPGAGTGPRSSRSDRISASPNPTRNTTLLKLSLPVAANVSVRIYDVTGAEVSAFEHECRAGVNSVVWDGSDNNGRRLAQGSYFVKVRSGDRVVGEGKVILTD